MLCVKLLVSGRSCPSDHETIVVSSLPAPVEALRELRVLEA